MVAYRCVNFNDLCRVCTASSQNNIDIFSEEGRTRNLHAKIAECLSLTMSEKDRLPKVLCGDCAQHIEEFFAFRSICKNSQATLNEMASSNSSLQKVSIATSSKNAMTTSGKIINVTAGMPIGSMQPTMALQTAPQPTIQTIPQTNELLNSIIQAIQLQPQIQLNQSEINPNIASERQSVQQYTLTFDTAGGLKTEPVEYKYDVVQPQQQKPKPQLAKNEKEFKHSNIEEFLKLKRNLKITPIGRNKDKQQQQQQLQQQKPIQTTEQQQQEQMAQNQLKLQLQVDQLQQQLNTQLQPQQFTLSAPSMMDTSDEFTSPSRSKNPKLNLVLTPPSPQTLSATLPQFTTPQGQTIQLQLQTASTGTTQQQAAAAFLSNFAPFLQQSQTKSITQLTANETMVSPTKCYLPITIKDGNSDQQIVGHIDTKNFVLPTTYQLEMKLQPQITTLDGQQIVQLAPTSIPATIQFTPQTTPMMQTTIPARTIPLQQQQQHQPISMLSKPLHSNIQITSQEIINPSISNLNTQTTNDVATSTTEEGEHRLNASNKIKFKQPGNTDRVLKQQRYTISQQEGSNTIEITPTAKFSHQIMQQVELQKKQKLQQQQQLEQQQQQQQQANNTMKEQPTIVHTQLGGITVQRITTTKSPVNKLQQQQQTQPLNKQGVTISRLNLQDPVEMIVPEVLPPTIKIAKSAEIKNIGPMKRKMNKPDDSNLVTEQQSLQLPTRTTDAHDSLPTDSVSNGFNCETCGRSFKKKEHLTQHVKLHAGLRPFKCTEIGCDKTFNRKEHLLRHQVSHSGKKMFTCDVCQKPFSRKDNLNKHRRIHPDQPHASSYECEMCPKKFSTKENYEQHKAMHAKSKTAGNKQSNAVAGGTTTITQAQPLLNHQMSIGQTTINAIPLQQAQPHQIVHLQLPDGINSTNIAGNSTITLSTVQPTTNQNQKTGSTQLGLAQNVGISYNWGKFQNF